MKRPVVLHPLLFALWIVLHWANFNAPVVLPEMVLVPSLVATAAAAVLLLVLAKAVKSVVKAGVMASAFIVWFFSYYFFVETLANAPHSGPLAGPFPTLLYLACWALTLIALWRVRSYAPSTNTVLNFVSVALVLFNAVPYALYEFRMVPIHNSIIKAVWQRDDGVRLRPLSGTPDIYYIILDGMGRSDVFRDKFGYDNSAFTDYLRQKGFYVATKSRANYAWTDLSVGSSLNMDYLNCVTDKFGEVDVQSLERLVQFNRVEHLLKTVGYKYVYCGSLTESMPSADANIDTGWACFFGLLMLETTGINVLPDPWNPLTEGARAKRMWFFRNVDQVASIPGPKFVFVHVLLPHNPYLFKKDGSHVLRARFSQLGYWENRQQYIEQAQYVEEQVKPVIETLLKDKQHQPIIILQGDHGPLCGLVNGEANPSFMQERMPILNAYFLPGAAEKRLYESISPVNSFRLIFNSYFGTKYPLLPDRSFYSSFLKPFRLTEVNTQSQQPAAPSAAPAYAPCD